MRFANDFLKSVCRVSLWLLLAVVNLAGAYTGPAEPVLHQVRIEEFSKSILAFDIANGPDLAAVALGDLTQNQIIESTGTIIRCTENPGSGLTLVLVLTWVALAGGLAFEPRSLTRLERQLEAHW